MRTRWEIPLRVAIGTALSVIAAIAILKYGDYYLLSVQPTHLYQVNSSQWTASIIWWGISGGIIGLLSGLAGAQLKDRISQVSFLCIPLSILLTALILTSQAFPAGELTLANYFLLAPFYVILFFIEATLPAFLIVMVTIGFVAGHEKRDVTEIQPRELKQQLAEKEKSGAPR